MGRPKRLGDVLSRTLLNRWIPRTGTRAISIARPASLAVVALALCLAPAALVPATAQILAPDLDEAVATNEANRPVLVNKFEHVLEFQPKDVNRGTHGAVYRLAKPTRVGPQEVQLGFDHDGNPRIARLVMTLSDNGTINQLAVADGIAMMAEALRPDWVAAPEMVKKTLAHAFDDYSPDAADKAYGIDTEVEGDRAALRIYPSRGKASFDIRPKVPSFERLDRNAATRLLEDSTLVMRPTDGRAPYFAYHAPDRLFTGQAEGAEGIDTGTWRIAADGTYCVELAPSAGWRCSTLVRQSDGAYALMDAVDGQPIGRIRAMADFEPGNPKGLFVARVADTLPPDMVAEITTEHTEERREAGAQQAVTAYFRADGTFKEGPEAGRWNVLQDGRRCWKVDEPDPGNWRCAFLRETDGGTFTLIDEGGAVIAEALIVEGNPKGW